MPNANYALIKEIESVETVDNVIVADEVTAATYLVANEGDYDYVLDVSLYSPSPGIGWTYDPGQDTFTAPPIDYVAIVRSEIVDVHNLLQQILADAGQLDSGDKADAISQALDDLSDEYTETEEQLFESITAYIANGG